VLRIADDFSIPDAIQALKKSARFFNPPYFFATLALKKN
jgi:hypothetical protein